MKMIGSVMDRMVDRVEEITEVMNSDMNDTHKAEFIVKLVHDVENECIIDDFCDRIYQPTGDVVYGG